MWNSCMICVCLDYPSSKPFNYRHIKYAVQSSDATSTISLFPRLSAYTCEPGNEARVLCVEKDLTWHIYTSGCLFPSRLYRLSVKWGQLLNRTNIFKTACKSTNLSQLMAFYDTAKALFTTLVVTIFLASLTSRTLTEAQKLLGMCTHSMLFRLCNV